METVQTTQSEQPEQSEQSVQALLTMQEPPKLTQEQKWKLLRQRITERPELGDRLLSREIGIDHKSINELRKRLEASGEIPVVDYTLGVDGKLHPRKTKPHASAQAPPPQEALPQDIPENKRCSRCGRILPIASFSRKKSAKDGHQSMCKDCRRQLRTHQDTDVKGRPYEIAPELRSMTKEEVIGNLYDKDRVIEFTLDDFKEEIDALTTTFVGSATTCLGLHKELMNDKKSKEMILGSVISLLSKEINKWKEDYDFEGI